MALLEVINKSSKFPWVLTTVLLAVGAVAALSVLSLLSHQGDVPNWGILVAILFGTFFVTWTWALMLTLRWRDQRSIATGVVSKMDLEALKGTVYGLVQGAEYEVMQTFTDHYQNQFQRGERLRFKERHFLPYHGGHTIMFDQKSLYLQEDANQEILSHFSDYLAQVDPRTS